MKDYEQTRMIVSGTEDSSVANECGTPCIGVRSVGDTQYGDSEAGARTNIANSLNAGPSEVEQDRRSGEKLKGESLSRPVRVSPLHAFANSRTTWVNGLLHISSRGFFSTVQTLPFPLKGILIGGGLGVVGGLYFYADEQVNNNDKVTVNAEKLMHLNLDFPQNSQGSKMSVQKEELPEKGSSETASLGKVTEDSKQPTLAGSGDDLKSITPVQALDLVFRGECLEAVAAYEVLAEGEDSLAEQKGDSLKKGASTPVAKSEADKWMTFSRAVARICSGTSMSSTRRSVQERTK